MQIFQLPLVLARPFRSAATSRPSLDRLRDFLSFPVALLYVAGIAMSDRAPAMEQSGSSHALAIPVEVQEVSYSDGYEKNGSYVGFVFPKEEVNLGFQLAGQIVRLLVDRGDKVTEGQLLAVLDTSRLQARKDHLQALLRAEKASSRQAQNVALRQESMVASGYVSDQQAEQSFAERDVSVAKVESLDAELALLEEDLEDSYLRAPFDGIVMERHLSIGAIVEPGLTVLRVVDTAQLTARVGVPVGVADSVQVGSRQRVFLAKEPVHAVVSAVMPEVNPRLRTRTVELRLPPHASAIVGEAFELKVGSWTPSKGVWVPRGALVAADSGLWAVFVVEKEADGADVVKKASVEVLHATGNRVFVRGTLAEGDRVVVAGAHKLTIGNYVLPLASDDRRSAPKADK